MKLAHLSDTHLGITQFNRTNEKTRNLREADVMASFIASLKAILDRDPDLVLHTGDFFERLQPSNAVLIEAFRVLARFQAKRSHRPFVIVAGNHETPHTSSAQSPVELLALIQGVHVAVRSVTPFLFEDFEVMAVPSAAVEGEHNVVWTPSGTRKHAILGLHGMEATVMPEFKIEFKMEEAHPDRWTYIGLGDYHVHRRYAANACYAGSTEYTTTNFWKETTQPKGWVWFDTEVGELELVPVETRMAIDLQRIDATDLDERDVNDLIERRSQQIPLEGLPMVRQRIFGLHPTVRPSAKLLAEIRQRCLNYELRTEWAKEQLTPAEDQAPPETLEMSWQKYGDRLTPPPGLKREEIVECGRKWLEEVRFSEAPTTSA